MENPFNQERFNKASELTPMLLSHPGVQEYLGTDDFLWCEGNSSELAQALDIHSGIDAFAVHSDGSLVGLSLRVLNKPYNTFTLRNRELEKHSRWLKTGAVMPSVGIVAYTDGASEGEYFSRIAACDWRELVEAAQKVTPRKSATGSFSAVSWNDLNKCVIIKQH